MKRTGFARPGTKSRKCKVKECRKSYMSTLTHQDWCSDECAAILGLHRVAKQKAAAERKAKKQQADDKRQTRAQLEALKTLQKLRSEAILAIQWFSRARDKKAGHGCICCGEPLDWNRYGGAVDGGHYLSKGAAPELALVEINVNAQRKSCNRPGGTTREKFRAGMVARYGEAAVSELEGPHEMPHYKHDDYRRLRDSYRRQAGELEKSCWKHT